MGATKTLAAAVGLLLFVALIGMAPVARGDVNLPVWSPGDFWVYDFTTTGPNATTGTFRMDMTGTESVVVNGTSYPTYHVDATLRFSLGIISIEIPADIWFSTGTLAIVKITAEVNLTLPGQPVQVVTYAISGDPPQEIRWPLRSGNAWASTTEVWAVVASAGNATYQNSTLTTDFLVQTEQTVNVPVGNLTTTPLRETNRGNGTYSINYWSSTVGNWAAVRFYDSTGVEQSSLELKQYRYVPPAGFLGQTFLGLSVLIWIILGVVVVLLIVAVAMRRRRRPPAVQTMPPSYEPTMPPTTEPLEGPGEENWR